MYLKTQVLISLCLLVLMCSCVKDSEIKPIDPPVAGPVVAPADTSGKPAVLVISFEAMVNGKPLVPLAGTYTNSSNDFFRISKFNYFISNVRLKRDDGYLFYEPESYHLLKHVGGSTSFTLAGMPPGNYHTVEFLIGVDSLRNVSGAQTGALDTGNDMYWNWNSGYIFYKLEGEYVSAGNPDPGDFAIHIGGFSGEFKCLQQCAFELSSPIIAKKNRQSKLTYQVRVEEIFDSPHLIGFDTYYASVTDQMFRDLSQNYRDMFVVSKIEN